MLTGNTVKYIVLRKQFSHKNERQTDRQMEIKTDRRTDRWNYRQTDREVIGGRMSEFKQ